jgi:hypothetical protein
LTLVTDRTRTLRGAVSGAVAAAVWAVEQPVDKRAFGCGYDDVELLGKALTRGENWYPVGLALHMANGALFGGIYANLAPALPGPAAVRGPLVGLGEHFGLWPLVAVTDRFHPSRGELPKLGGNRRAFYQAMWRHLLFGLVLGELERRLNAGAEPPPPVEETDYSSNGHGRFEHTLSVTSAGPAPGDDAD